MTRRPFHLVQPEPAGPEHRPVCCVCGEAWPCRHHQQQSHQAMVQRQSVRCYACGKLRNARCSLTVVADAEGRTIYFHARKRCCEQAQVWWEKHVRSVISKPFIHGLWIDDLPAYLGRHAQLKPVE